MELSKTKEVQDLISEIHYLRVALGEITAHFEKILYFMSPHHLSYDEKKSLVEKAKADESLFEKAACIAVEYSDTTFNMNGSRLYLPNKYLNQRALIEILKDAQKTMKKRLTELEKKFEGL